MALKSADTLHVNTVPTDAAPRPPAPPVLGSYRDADPGAPSIGLIAFALHHQAVAEGHVPPDAEARFRQQADTMFRTDAFRYLHNRVEEIRTEAAAAARAGIRKPPGLVGLVMANVIALVLVGAAALAVAGQFWPAVAATRAAVTGLWQ